MKSFSTKVILISYCIWSFACTPPMDPKSMNRTDTVVQDMGVTNESMGGDINREDTNSTAGTIPVINTCQPQCNQNDCGDDGCGGVCGTCGDGQVCQVNQCVNTETCDMTCESQAAQCGMVCGENCGTCAQQHSCEQGRCICQPDCRNKTCGADDGCGGICEPCPRYESCDHCVLQLKVIEEMATQGRVHTVRVELKLQLASESPHPQMADIRLLVKGPGVLSQVGASQALQNAQKSLIPDIQTGLPYRRSPSAEDPQNTVYSFTILSTQNTTEIESGSWLIFDFHIGDTQAEPVEISLIKREQIFAPIQADSVLWGDDFNQSIVIWPTLEAGDTP